MKIFKKALAVVMCVVIALTAAPLGGLVGLELPSLFDFNAEAASYSGTCGDNVKWSLDTYTGVLNITGSGAMKDYNATFAPWYRCRSYIRTVYIGTGVTSVGSCAFVDCTNLTKITISSSVTTIVDTAFWLCYSLTSITVDANNKNYSSDSNGVLFNKEKTTLIHYPIRKTETSYTIPDSVTTIGDYAFYDCYSLTSITIPDSVTTIGDRAFDDCNSLTSITVDANNKNYSSDSYGVLFNKDKTTLIQYPLGNTRTSYVVPDNVITIGNYAFNSCNNLTSVTIGNSATSIGDRAFYDSPSLTSITIGNSVTTIGYEAFSCCDSLTSVTMGNNVTTIGYEAFELCTSLTNITIPDSVTSIGSYAFSGCTGLTSVTIGDSVTSIGSYVFRGCTGLTSVTIPDSVTTIELYSFIDCTSLTNVTIPDSVTSIGDYAFSGCDSLTSVTIPDSVTSIGFQAFRDCSNLISVYYGSTKDDWNRIKIGTYNESLTSAKIYFNHPDYHTPGEWEIKTEPTCTNEGASVKKCIACDLELETQPIDALGHTYGKWETKTEPTCTGEGISIKKCAVCNEELETQPIDATGHTPGEWEIKVEPTCTGEGVSVKKCTVCEIELETQPIDATGHTYGEWEIKTEPTCTGEGVSVKKCTVCQAELETQPIDATGHTDGEWKITTNPTTATEGIKTLYCATCNEPLKTATVPLLDPVCDYLEWKVNEDKTVTITDCDTSYSGEFSIPAAIYEYPVTGIGSSAFYNCDNITKITIPATVTSIKDEEYSAVGFHTCDNLESIVVDEANENYSSENGVLYNKDKTKLISVPAKAIDGEFVMPSTVTTVSRYAFDAHNGIKLTLSDNLSSVEWSYINAKEFVASDNCTKFSTVDGVLFNKAETTLYRFPIASDITKYDIPEGVWHINDYAFYKSSIKQVTIPSSVNFINSMAFYNCEQLERVDCHCLDCWCCLQFEDNTGNPLRNGAALYVNDVLVDDLDVGEMHEEGIQIINAYAFCGYEHFRSLTIPSTVWKIGREAFIGCDNLKLLTVLGNVTEWGTGVFKSCPDLYTVQFAEGTTEIGDEAFWLCASLQQLYIPSTMTYIGNAAFYGYYGQTIDKICFGGTSSQWSKVDKSVNNFRISYSTISYHKHTTSSATKLVDVVNPTCTETGYTGDRKNSSCLMYTSLGKVVPATGHTAGEWETKVEPGCVSEGTKVKKCTVCKEEVETDTIPVTGHDYKAVVTKPTCTVDGYTTHTCSVCKDSYTDSVVKAEGHKYDSVVTPNTCTKDGYTTHTCSVCGDTYTDSETKATGHSHESKVTKEPTCTNTGIRTFTCHCGDSYTEVIKANGHTKGEWEYIGGNEYAKSCTVCGDKLESKIITVSLFFNGENVNKKQVLNKSTATVTATVTDNFVNDLVFASSDSSTVSVDVNGNVVANNIGKATITVTIKGTAISDSIEVEVLPRDFTVTWNVNGKQTKQTVKEEAKFTPNVNTTLKGYKFIGWDRTVPTTMPAENLTFTAQYELIVKQLKIKNPSTSTINYGETLVMHADFGGVELPEGWTIQWTVEGAGFNMAPAADGLTCKMTSIANGNATVKATLVDENGEAVMDANGNEMSDSKQLTSKAGFWQKFVSFFKKLFGISRIILQSI